MALVSVSDKTGVVAFAQGLAQRGFVVLSTGGTARTLKEGNVPCTLVSEVTDFPEIMGGRVKTLHPKIHGGILARRGVDADEAAEHGISMIDLVAVNLYPFEQTIQRDVDMATAMEKVDIGGPTMVRAAAKNHAHVTVVVEPSDYDSVLQALDAGGVSDEHRRRLSLKAFRHTARYDSVISGWLAGSSQDEVWPAEDAIGLKKSLELRYGENPHQQAAFYIDGASKGRSLGRITQHQGKQLSFNNLADMDAALRLVFDFQQPACAIIKHMNPCGLAVAEGGVQAFQQALAGDPVSAYGSIVAFNRALGIDEVRALKQSRVFFEVIAAPGFSDAALQALAPRKKLRVVELPEDWAAGRAPGFDARRVQGGWLFQDWDVDAPMEFSVATTRAPSASEEHALRFAWIASRAVKSNAIVLARAFEGGVALNGVGAGQMSRVDSVRLATMKATAPIPGCVLASDAFFPFADGLEAAAEHGVSAVIQPGGSIRDAEVVEAANKNNMAMVFTGTRHFRH